jgi:hypothetical protein
VAPFLILFLSIIWTAALFPAFAHTEQQIAIRRRKCAAFWTAWPKKQKQRKSAAVQMNDKKTKRETKAAEKRRTPNRQHIIPPCHTSSLSEPD